MNTMKKIAATAITALTLTGFAAVDAQAAGHRPDTDCMRAGIATLKEAGLLSTVAKSGFPLELAAPLKIQLRDPDTDLSAFGDSIPFSVVLADHRAGDSSLLIYPWCEAGA